MSDEKKVVHLFSGYRDGDHDVVTSFISVCCKKFALDSTLQGTAGTVDPEGCTCPELEVAHAS